MLDPLRGNRHFATVRFPKFDTRECQRLHAAHARAFGLLLDVHIPAEQPQMPAPTRFQRIVFAR